MQAAALLSGRRCAALAFPVLHAQRPAQPFLAAMLSAARDTEGSSSSSRLPLRCWGSSMLPMLRLPSQRCAALGLPALHAPLMGSHCWPAYGRCSSAETPMLRPDPCCWVDALVPAKAARSALAHHCLPSGS